MYKTKSNDQSLRFDLEIIASWIKPKSRILELGCGDGELLCYFKTNKGSHKK